MLFAPRICLDITAENGIEADPIPSAGIFVAARTKRKRPTKNGGLLFRR